MTSIHVLELHITTILWTHENPKVKTRETVNQKSTGHFPEEKRNNKNIKANINSKCLRMYTSWKFYHVPQPFEIWYYSSNW